MNWIEFRNKMFELGCFSIHQVYAWQPGFDRNNFARWIRKGYLVRLRQGLSTTHHARKMTFIGGTNLRLLKGIDRFSEDLDFDCKNLSGEEFNGMSDDAGLSVPYGTLRYSGFARIEGDSSQEIAAIGRSESEAEGLRALAVPARQQQTHPPFPGIHPYPVKIFSDFLF